MSPDTRRRVMMAVIALIVVAFVLSTAACTSTTDQDGEAATDGERLDTALYPDEMNQICAATNDRLAELPDPPSEISTEDWAGEVALILGSEAEAFDGVSVSEQRRGDHEAFAENTLQQSQQWAAVATSLRDSGGTEPIGDLTTDIAELTLGRNELAGEMGLSGCTARQVAGQ